MLLDAIETIYLVKESRSSNKQTSSNCAEKVQNSITQILEYKQKNTFFIDFLKLSKYSLKTCKQTY